MFALESGPKSLSIAKGYGIDSTRDSCCRGCLTLANFFHQSSGLRSRVLLEYNMDSRIWKKILPLACLFGVLKATLTCKRFSLTATPYAPITYSKLDKPSTHEQANIAPSTGHDEHWGSGCSLQETMYRHSPFRKKPLVLRLEEGCFEGEKASAALNPKP